MLYPMLFKPIIKKMIWGSESWDISCRPEEMGQVENGPLTGMSFEQVLAKDPGAYLGSRGLAIYQERGFPLLVKIIDARDDLSVQVHPDDDYAKANGYESGKNEMWYVMEAPPEGSLIIGLNKNTTKEQLQNNIMSCLKKQPIKAGDIINIPAGLVHALTSGVVVAEIQQNSDVTFRLYDYERKDPNGNPRELHIKQGLEVIKDNAKEPITHFSVIKQNINGTQEDISDPESFAILTCVEGSCEIYDIPLTRGRSIFIPAGLGPYTIKGQATILKSTV